MGPTARLVSRLRSAFYQTDLDALSPEARSRERYKRLGLTAIASMGASGVRLLTALVSIPLALHYLGEEQYGLWVAITSITAFLGAGDLGLGNGLLQLISEAHGRIDKQAAQRYVSSAVLVVSVIGLLIGAAFALTYPFVEWGSVFNSPSAAGSAVAGPAIATLVYITVLSLPLDLVQGVRLGYQDGFRNGIWQAVGNLLSLIALVIAVSVRASLPWLAAAIAAGPVVANLLSGSALLRQRPWLTPNLARASLPVAMQILKIGAQFLLLNVAFAVAISTDNLVIAHILGAAEVTQYAVPLKIFMIVPLVLGFGLVPLWPAYREAFSRGDSAWARLTFVKSLQICGVVAIPLSLGLVLVGRPLLHLWVGASVAPSTLLLVALGFWSVVYCVSTAFTVYFHGANLISFEVKLMFCMMVVNVPLSIYLTHAVGVSGPAWGSTISVIVCYLLPCALRVRRGRLGARIPALPDQSEIPPTSLPLGDFENLG